LTLEHAVDSLQAARQALQAAQERYDELFEFTTVGSLVTDSAGTIIEANAAAAHLWMTKPQLLVGKPVAVFVPLDQRKQFRERLVEAAEAAETHRFSTEFHGRDGARVAAEVTVAGAVADEESGRLRWVIQDVSERHVHAERLRRLASEHEEEVLVRTAELEEQRALLEAVIKNIPDAVLVVDTNHRPTLVNREALELLGLEAGQEAVAFVTWDSLELVRLDGTEVRREERPIGRTLNAGEVVNAEIFDVVVKGRNALLEVTTAPVISISGQRIGALALIRDVTIRERAEQAERDFVTNAAHELQSPLAAIVSAVEVLQAGAKDGAERDTFLGHIEREADRLARLARALLILARTQIGVEAPRDELVGVRALLAEVADGLKLRDGVEVEVECDDDLAALTNRELVEQAVINLAENAAKQTRKGRIVLSGHALSNRFVELAVADSGPGIPAAERAKVFDRFYRSDGEGAPGFGLGLAIVRAVSDALEGELELDSAVGVGTTVRLRISGAARLVQR
jgi:two-component system, OmpR family, phosphate regulon sensor histidine kinase PhoR